jgi:hypothetical protein
MLGTVLIILCLVLLFGGLPVWNYHQLGWGPSSLSGIVLIVLLILLLTGRL